MTNEEMYIKAIKMIENEIDSVYSLIDDYDDYQKWSIDAWQTLAGIKCLIAALETFKEDASTEDCNKAERCGEIAKTDNYSFFASEAEDLEKLIVNIVKVYNRLFPQDSTSRIDEIKNRRGDYIYEFVRQEEIEISGGK